MSKNSKEHYSCNPEAVRQKISIKAGNLTGGPSPAVQDDMKDSQDDMNNTKRNLVKNIFSDVASKYDLMNDLMSFGMHRMWKKELVRQIPNLRAKILDVASGSGDIAFRIIKKAKARCIKPSITLCDINEEMIKVAKARAVDNNILEPLNYVCTDAEKLPFPDNSFDYYTIAFGIRNVSNINNVLKEAYRVLKPTGKFLCLEFSKVENNYLESLYNYYSSTIIPKMGQIVTENKEAYQYLIESIKLFPDQIAFKTMIQDIGFSRVKYTNLTFGVVAIHSGYKF